MTAMRALLQNRLMRRALFAGMPLLLLCAGFAAYASFGSTAERFELSSGRTVTLTEDGFTPKRLVIKQGDTVTFTSVVAGEYWPASHPHPTHTTYAQFDPKKPIEEGGTWAHTFTRPGIWRYHDHLASNQEGEIVVLDYREGVPKYPCPDPGDERYGCFEAQIEQELAERGLDAALDRMAALYEKSPTFQTLCHAIAHTLGKAGYRHFEQGKQIELSGKTSYCSYGFYHGFMEEMLQSTGSVEKAREFCASTGQALNAVSANAEGACYHGIGHGAVDGGDPRDWGNPKALVDPGLELCEQVGRSEQHFYRCASGAFNSLALMYIYNEYDLKADERDLFAVCRLWDEERLQKPCYFEMNTLVMRRTGADLSRAIAQVERIPESAYAAFAMKGVAGILPARFTEPFERHFEDAVAVCQSARADLRTPCVEGVAIGLMEAGKPGEEYKATLSFCDVRGLTEDQRFSCKKAAFSSIRAYYSKDEQAVICATIEKSLRPYCVEPEPRL